MGNHDTSVRAAFGDTNRAGSVPDYLAPSDGPVYLEGRLVLSLSFKGDPDGMGLPGEPDDLLERYRLWDDLAGEWHDGDLEVLRFEQADVVVRLGQKPAVLWQGAVDTHARIVPMPDLDEAGMAANRECALRWRRV